MKHAAARVDVHGSRRDICDSGGRRRKHTRSERVRIAHWRVATVVVVVVIVVVYRPPPANTTVVAAVRSVSVKIYVQQQFVRRGGGGDGACTRTRTHRPPAVGWCRLPSRGAIYISTRRAVAVVATRTTMSPAARKTWVAGFDATAAAAAVYILILFTSDD